MRKTFSHQRAKGVSVMLGTWVNVGAILAGTAAGCLLKKGIPDRIKRTLMQSLGLCTLLIGIRAAILTNDMLCVIVSLVAGTMLGSAAGIERRLNALGVSAERLITRGKPSEQNTFAKAFVTSSLVFCVGAMAVVGSLDSGLKGDHAILIAKSALDGVASVVFASTLGPGVALSALSVLLYQGAITLLSGVAAPVLSAAAITEMSAAGGLVIVGIGFNLALDHDIKIGDMLPAIFIPLIYLAITGA